MEVLTQYATRARRAARVAAQRQCLRLTLGFLVAILGASETPVSGATDEAPTEYEVKAAFIFKFVSFVEWPEESFPENDTPIRIGILGEDPFGTSLDRTIEGKSVRGRTLEARRSNDVEELSACHMVFVAQPVPADVQSLTTKLHERHILTIGDSADFAKRGGIINFVEREGKIRFEINAKSAQRANIRISSQLLSLAHLIESEEDGEEDREEAPA
ncbi:MAG: hypothetical protein AMXMBFR82_11740 [Candidatus Hydrogenedentota bacterium]